MAGPIPPNPGEIVTRPSLYTVIDQFKEHYDYILIDTAPVGLVTDTLQVGKVSDATLSSCVVPTILLSLHSASSTS